MCFFAFKVSFHFVSCSGFDEFWNRRADFERTSQLNPEKKKHTKKKTTLFSPDTEHFHKLQGFFDIFCKNTPIISQNSCFFCGSFVVLSLCSSGLFIYREQHNVVTLASKAVIRSFLAFFFFIPLFVLFCFQLCRFHIQVLVVTHSYIFYCICNHQHGGNFSLVYSIKLQIKY